MTATDRMTGMKDEQPFALKAPGTPQPGSLPVHERTPAWFAPAT